MTRSIRRRLRRRGVSPYVWGCVPVVSPYMGRLRAAAWDGMVCRYVVMPVSDIQSYPIASGANAGVSTTRDREATPTRTYPTRRKGRGDR